MTNNGLNYSQLKDLFPRIEEASNEQEQYSRLASNNPSGLEAHLRDHAVKVSYNFNDREKEILQSISNDRRRWSEFAQLGGILIRHQYGEALSKYTGAFSDNPETAIEGAPDRVYKAIVSNSSKAKVEDLKSKYKTADRHLDFIDRRETLQRYQSQGKEGDEARKKVRDTYESIHISNYKGKEELFRDFTAALGADIYDYQETTKEVREEIVGEIKSNREYAVKAVGANGIRQIVETDFTRGLPEE